MKPEIGLLSNGLRVVTQNMPHLETSSLGVWVGVGSRHETGTQHGLSHLLEHMAFKGTSRRSAQGIAEEIEAVGGDLNAATSVETTAYYARVLKGDEGLALEILADILLDSTFAAPDLEREREVILQEIAAIEDSPDELVYDLVHDAAYPGQAAGRPIIGTPHSVKHLSASDLRLFLASHYHPGNMVIAAAGAVRHEPFLRHVEALFGGLSRGQPGADETARYTGGLRSSAKPFEQSHLMIGFEGPSYTQDDYITAQVLSGLLGGGMSSRLFQEVREKRGLCYSIYSSAWGLRDSGMFAVHAATGVDMMEGLIDVVRAELARVASEGVTAPETARSKAQLKAGLLMSLESSSSIAETMARQMLVHGRIVPGEELVAKVNAVTSEQLRTFAARLVTAPPSVAVAGAGRRSREFAERAGRSQTH
ncbi:MAG: pitrilysin family protein [Hyphomicrobium sp.]